jgi:hypothetical protein
MKKLLLTPVALICGFVSWGQYCLPTFNSQCTSGDYINTVTFNTISNLGTGCPNPSANNYTDYTSISTSVQQNTSYTITVQPGPTWGQYFVAYIDFNNDFDFDDPGEFFNIGYAGAGTTIANTIMIPNGIPGGPTRMRVLCRFSTGALTAGQACATGLSFGECEDYTLNIAPPPPNEAGITSFVTPTSLPTCDFTDSVRVELFNYGSAPLTSAAINLSINAGAPTTFNWTGSIAPFNSETVTLGLFSLTNGDNLVAYTSMPNGVTENPLGAWNDTVEIASLIINSNTGTDVFVSCDPLTWIDGNTYTASNNTATHTLTNAAGCDSIVTLNLTINSSTATDVQTACETHMWIDGNTYTASNNTATFTLTNAAGCDSIVTLDLTINNATAGTDVQTACETYTWIDGITYTSGNNTATWTLTNQSGCDSLVTLDLTINSVSDINTSTNGLTISADNSDASYVWLDCNDNYSIIPGETGQSYTATANGNYAVQLAENGCVDTSACVAITTVGILENSFGDNLLIYPNPTKGNFSIDLGAEYASSVISIADISGKLIYSKSNTHSQILNLSIDAPAGIYIVSIQAGMNKAVIRLVKE